MNTAQNITSPKITERHKHKVIFKPQGILGFVYSILPKGGFLKFEKNGSYACACFDNTIDFNNFKAKLALIATV